MSIRLSINAQIYTHVCANAHVHICTPQPARTNGNESGWWCAHMRAHCRDHHLQLTMFCHRHTSPCGNCLTITVVIAIESAIAIQ